MPTPFLSSEEYDERAHSLYNEGQYDQALDVLREGLSLYPNAVELHVGLGYARLAREEYAWARRAFDEALVLDAEHEDALAGLGETLMKFGQQDAAVRCFRRTLELGYQDDIDLMLQIGRALFREGLIEDAKEFFEIGAQQAPDSAEAVACVGYAQHRLGDDDGAITTLRRALPAVWRMMVGVMLVLVLAGLIEGSFSQFSAKTVPYPFKIAVAERMAQDFPNATLVRIPDSYTFVALDQPERLAEVIATVPVAEDI